MTYTANTDVTCLFLSHSKKDVRQAHKLRRQLIEVGYPAERVFIDDDPRHGLIPGIRWRNRLGESLRRTVCLLVLSTENWRDSKWCHGEAMVADSLGRKILPLDTDGSWETGNYGDIQALRKFDVDDCASITRLLTALESLDLAIPSESSPVGGWTVPAFSVKDFNLAVLKAWTQIFGIANLVASLATFLVVLSLLWFLVIQPFWIERSRILSDRRDFAVEPSDRLSEIVGELSTSEAIERLREREGDADRRLGVQLKLTERLIRQIKQERQIDVESSGFDLALFFANPETWPIQQDDLREGWWLATGEVQGVNFAQVSDDSALGIRLQPVQQLSIRECVPFEKIESLDEF